MIKKINSDEANKMLKQFFPQYIETNDPYEIILAYDNIGIISYSVMYERAEINYIAVEKEYRNRGIASILLKHALDNMKNVEVITLEVEKNNVPAINLYEKYGFKKESIRHNYYNNNDAYLMVKKVKYE